MSLAAAMYHKLANAKDPAMRSLHTALQQYGVQGFYDTEADARAQIKTSLNELLALTIREADIIVCTVAAAAKVNLINNLNPAVVFIDECARLPELKCLIPISSYSPTAWILTGDHKQMRPTVLSAGRLYEDPPFTNPFENQVLLSLFERFILAGYEHKMLTVQHRCRGDISPWVSQTFYHGRVTKALMTTQQKDLLAVVRSFTRDQLGIPTATNRYAVNIQESRSLKEQGGKSSLNTDELNHIMADLALIHAHPELQNMSVCIMSFYKAQVTRFKALCSELPGVTVVDGNEHLSRITVKTVDSAQGTEFDIVLISFVQTRRSSFLGEPHRLNVALTRARWLLGIYSNWELIAEQRSSNKYLVRLFNDLTLNNQVTDRQATPVVCANCQQPGHMVRNCPENRVPHCRRCQEYGDYEEARGHLAQNCTRHERPPRCRQCGTIGHRRANCPQVTCAICRELGHSATVCAAPCNRCRQTGHTSRTCHTLVSRAYLHQLREARAQEEARLGNPVGPRWAYNPDTTDEQVEEQQVEEEQVQTGPVVGITAALEAWGTPEPVRGPERIPETPTPEQPAQDTTTTLWNWLRFPFRTMPDPTTDVHVTDETVTNDFVTDRHITHIATEIPLMSGALSVPQTPVMSGAWPEAEPAQEVQPAQAVQSAQELQPTPEAHPTSAAWNWDNINSADQAGTSTATTWDNNNSEDQQHAAADESTW